MLIRDSLNNRREPRAVLAGAEVQSLVELPSDNAHPKAVEVGIDGNLYVTSFCRGDIWRITPDGNLTTWVDGGDDLRAASGLAFTSTGELYVIDAGDCDPREGTASIKRITADGQTISRVEGIDRDDVPTALAVDQNDVVYFTDTQHHSIRYIDTDGTIRTWWRLPEVDGDEASPTGLAYDALNDALVVADTASGTIYRVRFTSDRAALQPEQVLYQDTTRELDGLAVDDSGRVFATLFNVNKVVEIIDGKSYIIAEEFREPSDLAYLNNALYVVNFDGVSLAPVISFFVSPSLPFTVDVITLPTLTPPALTPTP